MDFNERCDWLIQYRSREKRIALLSQDNTLSAAALAERIGITPKVVEKQIAALKANGVHQRTGQGRILAGGRKNGLIFWRERSLPPAFFIVFQKNALL